MSQRSDIPPGAEGLYMRYLGTLNVLAQVARHLPRQDDDRYSVERALQDACDNHPTLEWGRGSGGGYYIQPKQERPDAG